MQADLLKEEYPVEKILDRKGTGQYVKYLVLRTGYPESESTWEPGINLFKYRNLIIQFEEQLHAKPIKRKSRLYSVIEMRILNGEIFFKVKWSKADLSTEFVPANKVCKNWPLKAIRFFQPRFKLADKKCSAKMGGMERLSLEKKAKKMAEKERIALQQENKSGTGLIVHLRQ